MAYKLEVDRRRGLARVTLSGHTSVEEQIALIYELVDHPDWEPTFDLLADTRLIAEPRLYYRDVYQIGTVARMLDRRLGSGRHAMVANTQLIYGCCRMAERAVQPCSRKLAVFRSVEEAERWLGLEEKEAGPHSGTRITDSDEPRPGKASDSKRPA